jgi:hypothetical protein
MRTSEVSFSHLNTRGYMVAAGYAVGPVSLGTGGACVLIRVAFVAPSVKISQTDEYVFHTRMAQDGTYMYVQQRFVGWAMVYISLHRHQLQIRRCFTECMRVPLYRTRYWSGVRRNNSINHSPCIFSYLLTLHFRGAPAICPVPSRYSITNHRYVGGSHAIVHGVA